MSNTETFILVTGTNGGLGLGICTRLLDDFLRTKPTSSTLTLIFTTRSNRKGAETLEVLKSHLAQHHSPQSQTRINLRPENVELTNLLSIHELAEKLLASSTPKLDAVILNAGIGGWSGLNWPKAIITILYDIVTNTTWPRFKIGIPGLVTDPQFPPTSTGTKSTKTTTTAEPQLGQVFCANLFGHYMLVHWLMPMLSACDPSSPGKVVWVSSIEPQDRHFNEDDLMGLNSGAAYEHSKRLTDLLALTYDQPNTQTIVEEYTATDHDGARTRRTPSARPTMHVAHPGICTTTIFAMHWLLQYGYAAAIYLARFAGSPWATCSTYTAALAFTWLALADAGSIRARERDGGGDGRVKWGTAVNRTGTPSVRPTEVEGWGIDGSGRAFAPGWWGGRYGRAPGATDATEEDVHDFVAQGARVWAQMEGMRKEWEGRIEAYRKQS